MDIQTGQVLWNGKLNYAESGNNNNQGGLMGAVLNAAITQIGESINDSAHDASAVANRLLFQNDRTGLLKGPLHPGFAAQMPPVNIHKGDVRRLHRHTLPAISLNFMLTSKGAENMESKRSHDRSGPRFGHLPTLFVAIALWWLLLEILPVAYWLTFLIQ